MIVTGNNLKALIRQFGMIQEQAYDQFSLSLTLDRQVIRFKEDTPCITYGQDIPDEWLEELYIQDGYILKPGHAILACSSETINMPKGYIGILQTKGSLARLFVTVHCCDGQVESGYSGKITFEICNMGPVEVKLLPGHKVGQLFVFSTSCENEMYNGQYNHANSHTISNKGYNNKKYENRTDTCCSD